MHPRSRNNCRSAAIRVLIYAANYTRMYVGYLPELSVSLSFKLIPSQSLFAAQSVFSSILAAFHFLTKHTLFFYLERRSHKFQRLRAREDQELLCMKHELRDKTKLSKLCL